MKILIAVLALAIASPAFAATAPRAAPADHMVIFNGKVIGQDPDPAVRFELRRDWGWQKGGEYR